MTEGAAAAYDERTRRALQDFQAFTEQAARLVERGRSAYDNDEMLRLAADAIIVKLGESVTRMDDGFISENPALQLRLIKDMRNLIAHEYDAIRPQLVWNALERELPVICVALAELLED